ncbi:GntR family transcriptional regulator [Salinibacterium sp. GXW1014]|uniref:GntR family transcriptional regulator n=1 Tax=Salinibacterium sp. GXW1014 TaxID=3377838 RepID=UPI00383A99E4
MEEGRPIFVQLAEQIENDILSGALPEESQVPSTNEFAAFHRINPATAGKGVNLLVDAGILYKKRGIGMFVATGSRDRIVRQRMERFEVDYVHPLLVEAAKLGLTHDDVAALIRTTTMEGSTS